MSSQQLNPYQQPPYPPPQYPPTQYPPLQIAPGQTGPVYPPPYPSPPQLPSVPQQQPSVPYPNLNSSPQQPYPSPQPPSPVVQPYAAPSGTLPLAQFRERSVFIMSEATNKNVRVLEDGIFDALGLTGPFARWKLHFNGSDGVAFQNEHQPTHWLRITQNGKADALGIGREMCCLHAEHLGGSEYAFRANNGSGYLAFENNGVPKPANQASRNDRQARFYVTLAN